MSSRGCIAFGTSNNDWRGRFVKDGCSDGALAEAVWDFVHKNGIAGLRILLEKSVYGLIAFPHRRFPPNADGYEGWMTPSKRIGLLEEMCVVDPDKRVMHVVIEEDSGNLLTIATVNLDGPKPDWRKILF